MLLHLHQSGWGRRDAGDGDGAWETGVGCGGPEDVGGGDDVVAREAARGELRGDGGEAVDGGGHVAAVLRDGGSEAARRLHGRGALRPAHEHEQAHKELPRRLEEVEEHLLALRVAARLRRDEQRAQRPVHARDRRVHHSRQRHGRLTHADGGTEGKRLRSVCALWLV